MSRLVPGLAKLESRRRSRVACELLESGCSSKIGAPLFRPTLRFTRAAPRAGLRLNSEDHNESRTFWHYLQPLIHTLPSKRLMAKHSPKLPEGGGATSASVTPLPEEAAKLYRDVLLAMNEHVIPYAVAGAFALQKYTGIWRITKDLDLFIKAEDVPAALESLCDEGFRCETPDPVWLSKARRGEYFVDLISGMSNAVIVVDDSWFERAQPAIVAEVKSQIISAEDLIASKLFVTRRERFDGADIAHIIYRTKGQLEWE